MCGCTCPSIHCKHPLSSLPVCNTYAWFVSAPLTLNPPPSLFSVLAHVAPYMSRTWFYKDVPQGVSVLEHNFDHPSALDEELMVRTITSLKRRESVQITP